MLSEKKERDANSVTGNQLFLMGCAAFAYSVLQRWMFHLHYPVAAVVDEPETADDLAEKWGIFHKNTINLNLPPMEFLRALEDFHDELCVVFYSKGRYAHKNIETLLDLIASGGYGNVEISFLPLIVFLRVIPEEYEDKFALVIDIHQDDLEKLDSSDIKKYFMKIKDFLLNYPQVAEREIRRCKTDKRLGKDSRFWSAVMAMVEIIFLDIEENSAEKLKSNLCFALRNAGELAESYELKMQISQLFRTALDEAIPEKCTFLQESAASELSEQEIEENVLYDAEFYYISDRLFSSICEPLKSVSTVNQIKEILASEGILCIQGQNRSYYSVKKKISRTNRFFRCIWLCRNVLEQNAELTFLDMFRIRGKKHE